MTRASVKTIAGFSGVNPPKDVIDLTLDKDEVHAGCDVTGTIRMLGKTPVKSIHLILEGIEYSVVAFPGGSDNQMGLEYLKKHTTEKRIVTKQEMLLDCAKPQIFRFSLAENLPSTMKCRIDGSDPTLPSQCQITYTVSATVYGKSSKAQVSHNLVVLPKIHAISPVDPCITVAIGSILDFFLKTMFSCGDTLCQVEEPDVETSMAEEKYIILEPNPTSLRLSVGQLIKVDVRDWLGLLSNPNYVWMIRLVERLSWTAKGRVARFRQSWDLYANHNEIPSTLRRTYDQDSKSLSKVFHEIIIYVKKKDSPKEVILATTEPIPIQIVSSSRGWDA